MKELKSATELISSLRLNELSEPNQKLIKKFGEFSFACGCGNVHSIVKQSYKHPAFSNTFWSDPTYCVDAICVESSRILFSCSHGFFTMVARSSGLFKTIVETDFTIDRALVDSHEQGLGLFISTSTFNLDFNSYGERKIPLPKNEIMSWEDFEKAILEAGKSSLSRLPKYMPHMDDHRFLCPCGEKHSMGGFNPLYALQQGTARAFCYPHVECGGKDLVYRCHNGYYSMVRSRPSLPVICWLKSEIVPSSRRSVTDLPNDIFGDFERLWVYLE